MGLASPLQKLLERPQRCHLLAYLAEKVIRVLAATLYATTTRREQFFSGLGVGNTTASVQDISCYRSIFQFLGRTIDKYDALKGCGLYEPNSPEIPAYIREHIENRIEPGDNAFVAA